MDAARWLEAGEPLAALRLGGRRGVLALLALAGLGAGRLPARPAGPGLVQPGALGVRTALSGAWGVSDRPARADRWRSLRVLQSPGSPAGTRAGGGLPARRSIAPTRVSARSRLRPRPASPFAAGGPQSGGRRARLSARRSASSRPLEGHRSAGRASGSGARSGRRPGADPGAGGRHL